jgi:hypothetical protein
MTETCSIASPVTCRIGSPLIDPPRGCRCEFREPGRRFSDNPIYQVFRLRNIVNELHRLANRYIGGLETPKYHSFGLPKFVRLQNAQVLIRDHSISPRISSA